MNKCTYLIHLFIQPLELCSLNVCIEVSSFRDLFRYSNKFIKQNYLQHITGNRIWAWARIIVHKIYSIRKTLQFLFFGSLDQSYLTSGIFWHGFTA